MLRQLCRSDLPQILAIEQIVHVAPWTKETFETCFHAGYSGWVMEMEQKVVGFIIISVREECHVLNLCVTHTYQRQGLGTKLLRVALEHAKKSGIGIAYLEVRRSNTRAISLYQKLQFHLVGERKDYYPTVVGNEDALIFALSLRD